MSLPAQNSITSRRAGLTVTRRTALRAALTASGAGLTLLGLSPLRIPRLAQGTLAAEQEELREPPVQLAENGVLETTLEAKNDPAGRAWVG